jgi:predicted nucleotidyltransferase component of viral defense system
MKTISPVQRGAVEEALRLGLTDLAPSILEKDLLITEVLGMLAAFDWGEIQAVFCGGTSLSKGHGVIQRMSEDIDFKLALPSSWSRSQARRKLSDCRKELAETMRAADFDLPEAGIVTLNENRYFCFSLGYLPQFPLVPALRAELRLDFTAHTPLLYPVPVQVRPLLAEFMELDAQVVEHQVVLLQETLAEKVVSFLRRTAGWQEQAERDPDDDMLVRHLYDVHQLLEVVPSDPEAQELQSDLFTKIVAGDQAKFGRQDSSFGANPRERLQQALAQLQTSAEVAELYERFVSELVWGEPVPFAEARAGFVALAARLLRGLDPPP